MSPASQAESIFIHGPSEVVGVTGYEVPCEPHWSKMGVGEAVPSPRPEVCWRPAQMRTRTPAPRRPRPACMPPGVEEWANPPHSKTVSILLLTSPLLLHSIHTLSVICMFLIRHENSWNI